MRNKLKSIFLRKTSGSSSFVIFTMVITAGLCFYGLARNSYTFDEVVSIIITRNWNTLWSILWNKEGNMWFYFFILHFWLKLGSNEFILRSLSAIFGVLTVPFFYLLARNIHSEKVAKISTLFFITNLYFIFYAQMARSYSLSLLLVTLSAYFFLKLVKNPSYRYVLPYILVSTLAIYTHLLVVLAIFIQCVYLLAVSGNSIWKKMIFSWVAIFICIVPLLLAPSVRLGHQLDWLQRPPFVHLPFGIVALAGDSVFLTIVSGVIILLLLWRKKHLIFKKSLERFYLLWLFLWAGFPIIFSYLFSFIAKPIYQPQYFNFCLPAFILLLAIGLEELKNKKVLYYVLAVILLFFSLLRLFQWYSGSTSYITQYLVFENNHPDDWKSAASYVVEHGHSTDAVIFYAYYVRESFEFYYDTYASQNVPKPIEISSGTYDIGGGAKIPEPKISLLDSLWKKYPRVWLILEKNNTSYLGKRNQWLEIEKELTKYYIVKDDRRLNQIEIKLFVKK